MPPMQQLYCFVCFNSDRQPAMEQRFASLKVTGSIWNDLAHMRSGVAMETTTMARNKILMNYNWFAGMHEH